MAAPMPLLAPVTTATRPDQRSIVDRRSCNHGLLLPEIKEMNCAADIVEFASCLKRERMREYVNMCKNVNFCTQSPIVQDLTTSDFQV